MSDTSKEAVRWVEHDRFRDGWGLPDDCIVRFEQGNIIEYTSDVAAIYGAPARIAALQADVEDVRYALDPATSGRDLWRFWSDKARALSVKLSEANTRTAQLHSEVKDMREALDLSEIEGSMTSDGNLWRFWSRKASSLAEKLTSVAAERDALQGTVYDGMKR